MSVVVSLAIILVILGATIIASLIRNRRTGTCPEIVSVQADACSASEPPRRRRPGSHGGDCPFHIKDRRSEEGKE